MRIYFDVNGTIVGDEGDLRPHTREVFQQIKARGDHVYLWSILGPRWDVVEEHQLGDLVDDCFIKPMPLAVFWPGHKAGGTPKDKPDLCVDDAPAYVESFGGVLVTSYIGPSPEDRELLRALDLIVQGTYQQPRPWRALLRATFAPVLPLLAPFRFLAGLFFRSRRSSEAP